LRLGPDPRVALQYIDKLGLYSTIFANHRDDVEVDTSSWSLAYNDLDRLLRTADDDEISKSMRHVRDILIRDAQETYYAWFVAIFSPWAAVPARPQGKADKKGLSPRVAEVARDSLKLDNKTVSVLSDAATYFREISDLKASLIAGSIPGTDREIRQHVGLSLRSWKKDWRMCVIMGILREIMVGAEFPRGKPNNDLNLL
jgi:tRNA nucleotidyltransferase (CCA-adding enzyme)